MVVKKQDVAVFLLVRYSGDSVVALAHPPPRPLGAEVHPDHDLGKLIQSVRSGLREKLVRLPKVNEARVRGRVGVPRPLACREHETAGTRARAVAQHPVNGIDSVGDHPGAPHTLGDYPSMPESCLLLGLEAQLDP